MGKFCSQCGNMMNDKDNFCGRCGAKSVLDNGAYSREPVLSYKHKVRDQISKYVFILLCMLIAIVILIGVYSTYFMGNSNKPKVDDLSFEIENIEEDDGTYYAMIRVTNNAETTINKVGSSQAAEFHFINEEGEVVCKGCEAGFHKKSYSIKQGESFYLLWYLGGAALLNEDRDLTREKAFSITDVICDLFTYDAGKFRIEARPSDGKIRSLRIGPAYDENRVRDASDQYDIFNTLKLDVDWSSMQKDKYGKRNYSFEVSNITNQKAFILNNVTIAIVDKDGSMLDCVCTGESVESYMPSQYLEPDMSATGKLTVYIPPSLSDESISAVLISYEYIIRGLRESDPDTRVIVSPLNHTVYQGDNKLFVR